MELNILRGPNIESNLFFYICPVVCYWACVCVYSAVYLLIFWCSLLLCLSVSSLSGCLVHTFILSPSPSINAGFYLFSAYDTNNFCFVSNLFRWHSIWLEISHLISRITTVSPGRSIYWHLFSFNIDCANSCTKQKKTEKKKIPSITNFFSPHTHHKKTKEVCYLRRELMRWSFENSMSTVFFLFVFLFDLLWIVEYYWRKNINEIACSIHTTDDVIDKLVNTFCNRIVCCWCDFVGKLACLRRCTSIRAKGLFIYLFIHSILFW